MFLRCRFRDKGKVDRWIERERESYREKERGGV